MARLSKEERRRLDELVGSPPEYKLPAWAYVQVIPRKDEPRKDEPDAKDES